MNRGITAKTVCVVLWLKKALRRILMCRLVVYWQLGMHDSSRKKQRPNILLKLINTIAYVWNFFKDRVKCSAVIEDFYGISKICSASEARLHFSESLLLQPHPHNTAKTDQACCSAPVAAFCIALHLAAMDTRDKMYDFVSLRPLNLKTCSRR